MKKIWYEVKYYYLTHDGIEMFIFACTFGFLGWCAYHAIVAGVERFFG